MVHEDVGHPLNLSILQPITYILCLQLIANHPRNMPILNFDSNNVACFELLLRAFYVVSCFKDTVGDVDYPVRMIFVGIRVSVFSIRCIDHSESQRPICDLQYLYSRLSFLVEAF